MTTVRPQRYDQCDDTCTVDCGHCKGKGRPVDFTAYMVDGIAAFVTLTREVVPLAALRHHATMGATR